MVLQPSQPLVFAHSNITQPLPEGFSLPQSSLVSHVDHMPPSWTPTPQAIPTTWRLFQHSTYDAGPFTQSTANFGGPKFEGTTGVISPNAATHPRDGAPIQSFTHDSILQSGIFGS